MHAHEWKTPVGTNTPGRKLKRTIGWERRAVIGVWMVLAIWALPALAEGGINEGGIAEGGINEVSYTIRGMAFEGPDSLPAGMTRLTVANETAREDMYALVSLTEGRTLPEFFTAMSEVMQGLTTVTPTWVQFHGGSPIGVADARSYTIFLSPGTYYLVSIGADEEGPYAARGLTKTLKVTAPEPEADVSVTAKDYEFAVEGTFRAGRQTVRLENAANQLHEMLIVPLPEGVSLEQLLAGMAAPQDEHADHEAEAAPELPMGVTKGLWVINPGTTAFVEVELAPGRYGIVCFVPDADGPHVMQGMAREFAVE